MAYTSCMLNTLAKPAATAPRRSCTITGAHGGSGNSAWGIPPRKPARKIGSRVLIPVELSSRGACARRTSPCHAAQARPAQCSAGWEGLDWTSPSGNERSIGVVSDEALDEAYDLVIVGGGPTGVAAALKGAMLGRRVLIVDKPKAEPDADGLDVLFGGGTGLFSQALRDAGKSIHVESLRSFGLYDNTIWTQVQDMYRRLASTNAEHQVRLLRELKVDYLQAVANIVAPNRVLVGRQNGTSAIVACEKILIATGSKPDPACSLQVEDERVVDSNTVNTLSFLPKRVAIIGSGVAAVENATIFRKLGSEVTLLVPGGIYGSLDHAGLDPDITRELLSCLEKESVTIYEYTGVSGCEVVQSKEQPNTKAVVLNLESSDQNTPYWIETDLVLNLPRRAKVSMLGIDKLDVALDGSGNIQVNDCFETSVPNLYAAGDVVGPQAHASTGEHQARAAVEHMFGAGGKSKDSSFPTCLWTAPECAYYGLTRAAAEQSGLRVQEGVAKYAACLKGRLHAPEGLVKLVFEQGSGAVVGAHLLGADACELVHYARDLVDRQVTVFELMETVFTSVTFHELFREAARDGDAKLKFGALYQTILRELQPASGGDWDMNALKKAFDKAAGDQGFLDKAQLGKLVEGGAGGGGPAPEPTRRNLVRLANDDSGNALRWPELEEMFTLAGERKREQPASPATAAPGDAGDASAIRKLREALEQERKLRAAAEARWKVAEAGRQQAEAGRKEAIDQIAQKLKAPPQASGQPVVLPPKTRPSGQAVVLPPQTQPSSGQPVVLPPKTQPSGQPVVLPPRRMIFAQNVQNAQKGSTGYNPRTSSGALSRYGSNFEDPNDLDLPDAPGMSIKDQIAQKQKMEQQRREERKEEVQAGRYVKSKVENKEEVKSKVESKEEIKNKEESKEEVKSKEESKEEVKSKEESKEEVKSKEESKQEVKGKEESKEDAKNKKDSKDEAKSKEASKEKVKSKEESKEEVKSKEEREEEVKKKAK